MQPDDVHRFRLIADACRPRGSRRAPVVVDSILSAPSFRSCLDAPPPPRTTSSWTSCGRSRTPARRRSTRFDELVVEPPSVSSRDPKPLPGLVLPPSSRPGQPFRHRGRIVQSVTVHQERVSRPIPVRPLGVLVLFPRLGAPGGRVPARRQRVRVLLPEPPPSRRARDGRAAGVDRTPYDLSSRPKSAPGRRRRRRQQVAYAPEGRHSSPRASRWSRPLIEKNGTFAGSARRARRRAHRAGTGRARLIMVAPAGLSVPRPPPSSARDGDDDLPRGGRPRIGSSASSRRRLERHVVLALVSATRLRLNVVRGSVNRQMAAIDEGRERRLIARGESRVPATDQGGGMGPGLVEFLARRWHLRA